MLKEMAMTEARHGLTALPRRLAHQPGAVAVTRRGRPVLAVLTWEFYESLVETLEIMSDEKLVSSLRRGIKELRKGKGVPWEQAKKELGW